MAGDGQAIEDVWPNAGGHIATYFRLCLTDMTLCPSSVLRACHDSSTFNVSTEGKELLQLARRVYYACQTRVQGMEANLGAGPWTAYVKDFLFPSDEEMESVLMTTLMTDQGLAALRPGAKSKGSGQ